MIREQTDLTYFNGLGLEKTEFSNKNDGKTILVKPENSSSAVTYPYFPSYND
ncbi:hypothetical protein MM300_21775 [Evansella sp. LMS18]|jgi:hypothetical protein|uniref:hypothetical protein n=1 Tax=Evansella sp. LMS18 TaxID=2924033 RepID=UPI0020D085F6|nr:hypothetical protein [Evansella sp. LMS18]UTR10464.1 hypothetical protein MM300_21775 [Evansella sp. LMS18]